MRQRTRLATGGLCPVKNNVLHTTAATNASAQLSSVKLPDTAVSPTLLNLSRAHRKELCMLSIVHCRDLNAHHNILPLSEQPKTSTRNTHQECSCLFRGGKVRLPPNQHRTTASESHDRPNSRLQRGVPAAAEQQGVGHTFKHSEAAQHHARSCCSRFHDARSSGALMLSHIMPQRHWDCKQSLPMPW